MIVEEGAESDREPPARSFHTVDGTISQLFE